MKKLIIIDGNSLLFRAYYATAYSGSIMRTTDGVPTNALFAFANMIAKIVSEFKGGEHVLVAWDTGEKTLRHELDDTYKANRPEAPEDLVPQFALAREFLNAVGIKNYELAGYEADDIAGSLAKRGVKDGYKVELITSDRDFLQLVEGNDIIVKLIKKGSEYELMNEAQVIAIYEMTPKQIIDYKGLRGDPSDNIPGVPGVGKVIGTRLIKEYGDIEKVIEAAPSKKGKVYENIVNHAEDARLSKKLATIITDIDIPISYDELNYEGYYYDELSAFAKRYELRQFMSRLSGDYEIKPEDAKDIIVNEVTSCSSIELEQMSGVYIYSSNEDYHKADLLGIALASKDKAYYLNVSDVLNDKKLIDWLENERASKVLFDSKAGEVLLYRYGINLAGVSFDLLLASYLIDASLKNDVRGIFSYFGISLAQDSSSRSQLCGEIALGLSNLVDDTKDKLEEIDTLNLYEQIELPLAKVLARMEIEGFPLNKETLLEIGAAYPKKMEEISAKIYEFAGKEFNIASPKQVGEVLFDDLNLTNPKKYSTAVGVLTKIADEHPIVDLILDYRKYAKLQGTYIDGLVNEIYEDGKLHTTFNQALTTTGRLSSTRPNLQNISIRDEEGREIRKAFYYDDEATYIVSFDYSQIELRIMAALASSPKLIKAFKEGLDIHTVTAQHLFHKQDISPNERRMAKAVNFGIIYGISDWGLSEQINSTVKEAKTIIESFYATYPEVRTFVDETIKKVENDGYVTTLLGRRRYLPGINDRSFQVRSFAKRAAMNAPIQGTAADLIKLAMVKIYDYLNEGNYKSKLVLQIHDELIFAVPQDELDEIISKIKHIMEHVYELDVPLSVDVGYGKTWFDTL